MKNSFFKFFFPILTGTLTLVAMQPAMAQTITITTPGNGSGTAGPYIIPKKQIKDRPTDGRQKSPSLSPVSFTYGYDDCRLVFTIPAGVSDMQVTVEDCVTGMMWSSTLDRSAPYMEAELGGSTYYIECVTGDGTVYGTTVDF